MKIVATVTLGFLVSLMAAGGEALASRQCKEPNVISASAAEAVITARVLAIYRDASAKLLTALAEKRLTHLGFEPSEMDREIARQHLQALSAGASSTPAAELRDISWPRLSSDEKQPFLVRHPARWLLSSKSVPAQANEACAGYAEVLACEATDKTAAQQRGIVRALLLDSGACLEGTISPTLTADPKSPYFAMLVAKDRFLKQYQHLADLRNAPFRKRGLEFQMLYADFFQQALKQGNVGGFAKEYLADSNPLHRFELHQDLGPLIGILLDNRIIN